MIDSQCLGQERLCRLRFLISIVGRRLLRRGYHGLILAGRVDAGISTFAQAITHVKEAIASLFPRSHLTWEVRREIILLLSGHMTLVVNLQRSLRRLCC